MLIRLFQEI